MFIMLKLIGNKIYNASFNQHCSRFGRGHNRDLAKTVI